MGQRLRLCVGIGKALLTMHSNSKCLRRCGPWCMPQCDPWLLDVIRGDLNPQNVLIVREGDGFGPYTAKVIDFGYSAKYTSDTRCIRVPIFRPWNAPEHTRIIREWVPSETKKLDIFSLGMLCLWILFNQSITETTLLPRSQGLRHGCQGKEETAQVSYASSMTALQDLMNEGKLLPFAQHLSETENTLDANKRLALGEFFGSAFANDPSQRSMAPGNLFDEQTLHL